MYVPQCTSQLPNAFPKQPAPSIQNKKEYNRVEHATAQITSTTAKPGSC